MQNNALMIETLHGQLLMMSRENRYGLEPLRCDWGNSGGKVFGEKQAMFCRGLRELAKNCPVKFYNGHFYMFNGKIYEAVPTDVIEVAYQQLMEDLQIAPMMNRLTVRNEVFLKTIKLCNPLVPQFDIVAFENGVVDFGRGLKEPGVMPFSPEYHVTYYHPYAYDPKAKCTRWMNFIHEVLPDKNSRTILQMFLGLGLVQRGNAWNPYEGKASSKIELCLLLVGTGANGKSVIFDVACSLFGKDRISKMDYADLTAEGDEGMRGRYPIRNAIFNWSSDSDPKKFGRKNTGMFKRLVSGEPVPMRELGKNVMESGTIPYLVFNLNELPFPEDASLGFIRRLQYVSFDVTIPKEKQDPELASKIIHNELSGVFNWVFRGMQELKKRRYQFPSAKGSRMQLLKSLLGSQPIVAWLNSYGIRSEREARGEQGVWISVQSLYASLTQFCKDNNVDEDLVPSMQKLGRQMWDKLSYQRRRKSSGTEYLVFGTNEEELKEHVLVGGSEMEEGNIAEPESFIKDDD